MRKILWVPMVMLLSGCSVMEFSSKSEEVAETTKRVTVTLQNAAEKAEPVVVAVEETVGPALTQSQVDSGQAYASTAEKVAQTAAGVAALIPGGQGIAAILAALVPLAGFVGRWFGKRKVKDVAKAAVVAADATTGGGRAITDAAIAMDVVPEIRSALAEVHPDA